MDRSCVVEKLQVLVAGFSNCLKSHSKLLGDSTRLEIPLLIRDFHVISLRLLQKMVISSISVD